MGNIDRKYAYHDDGVLPAQGEYGVTYLTLYSSGAGNIYDGWIWDPDRINYSETVRTFGYRNPSYPDYCWDDEVVVDLSNAQTRQEGSSDAIQGRIVSFNTNVSDRPILLSDIDVTGMTEEEREARATTVLFTAIPLVKDAYIQANIEIAMKMNLSPDNTIGNIRVEAFYIVNNESDRTMRPHPINHYAVTRSNEYGLFNPLYFNFALNHEDHNYIGVKLIVSGGTAEIGISDDPDYGDAIITITSFGMTGDKIDDGKPVSLEIFGREEAPIGYRIDPDDYTVLCTYDTDEIYDVTNLCAYNPELWTEMFDNFTLIATYHGLTASLPVMVDQIDYIEIQGVDVFHESYELNINDYVVYAYTVSGDIIEITDKCSFYPAIGTTLTDDTVLTATYITPNNLSFSDSMNIEAINDAPLQTATSTYGGLLYSLYRNGLIEITGNADHTETVYIDGVQYEKKYHETINIPEELLRINVPSDSIPEKLTVSWRAEGSISGFWHSSVLRAADNTYRYFYRFANFHYVNIRPMFYGSNIKTAWQTNIKYNNIGLNFAGQKYLTSNVLRWLDNVDCTQIEDIPVSVSTIATYNTSDFSGAFSFCEALTDINFLSKYNVSNTTSLNSLFNGCKSLNDISGIASWRPNEVINTRYMFKNCSSLKAAGAIFQWKLRKCENISDMFDGSGLVNTGGLGHLEIGFDVDENTTIQMQNVFGNCSNLEEVMDMGNLFDNVHKYNIYMMFYNCQSLIHINGLASCDTSKVVNMSSAFAYCTKLFDLSYLYSWNTSSCQNFRGMFSWTKSGKNIEQFSNWDVSACVEYANDRGIRANEGPLLPGFLAVTNGTRYTIDTSDIATNLIWPNALSGVKNLFFQLKYDSTYKLYYIQTETSGDIIPGTTQKYTMTYGGILKGYDEYRVQSHMKKVGDAYEGYAKYIFRFGSKIPNWYKQMIVDDYRERMTAIYTRQGLTNNVVYSYENES